MDKIGFSIKRRPRTNKLRMKEMEISGESKALVVYPGGGEDSKALVVYPGGGEDGTPLGSHPEGVTVNEREESANVPPGPVKASQLFKHLCKPAVYVDNVVKMGFTSAHVEIIKKTPFGALVDMQPFVVDGRLLADIVRCHQGGDVFIFCGKVVSFSAEDLALILGLPCRGMKIVDAGQKKEGRLYRRFGQHFDLHNKGLLRLITDLVSSKIQDDIEDTVRLWIAYMFAMFLAPKSNQSCPRYFIPYLDDLSLLGEMDWTSAIKELTVAGLAEVASCLRSDEPVHSKRSVKGRRQPILYGCSAALVAWFLEHSTLRAPLYPLKFPRLLRWYDTKQKVDNVQVVNLNINKLIEGAIVPTVQEQLLITAGTVALLQDNKSSSWFELKTELQDVRNILIQENKSSPSCSGFKEELEEFKKKLLEENKGCSMCSEVKVELDDLKNKFVDENKSCPSCMKLMVEVGELKNKMLEENKSCTSCTELKVELQEVKNKVLEENKSCASCTELKVELQELKVELGEVNNKVVDGNKSCRSCSELKAELEAVKTKMVEGSKSCGSCAELKRELDEVNKKLAVFEDLVNSLLNRDSGEHKSDEQVPVNVTTNEKRAPSVPSLVKRVKNQPRRRKGSELQSEQETKKGKMKAYCEEDDEKLVNIFLQQESIDEHETIYINKFNGCVTRKMVYDLLNKDMIMDDVIDAGQDFLLSKWVAFPERYYKCIVAPVMTAGLCVNSPSPIAELAGTAGTMIFNELSDDAKASFRFLFTIINSENSHWHLVAVDVESKVVLHLNSLKRVTRHKSNARKWKDILSAALHIYCDIGDVMNWPLQEVADCPSQPARSLDCGLYCLKFMECLARRESKVRWGFKQENINIFRHQLAANILRDGLDQKISGAYQK